MCEYCESNKAIATEIKQTGYFISSMVVGIEKGNSLVSQTIIQWADGITNPMPKAEEKINFCPICGRKLSEVSE